MPSRRSLPELGIKLLWDCMLGGTPRNLPVRAMVENPFLTYSPVFGNTSQYQMGYLIRLKPRIRGWLLLILPSSGGPTD